MKLINKNVFLIGFAVLFFSLCFSQNSLKIETINDCDSGMFLFELKMLDLKEYQSRLLDLESVLIPSVSDSEEYLMELYNLENLGISTDQLDLVLDCEEVNKYFRNDFKPSVVTVIGETAKVKIQADYYRTGEEIYDNFFSFSVLPTYYDPVSGVESSVDINCIGFMNTAVNTEVRLNPGEWVPIAVASMNEVYLNDSFLKGEENQNGIRYSIIYIGVRRISNEELGNISKDIILPFSNVSDDNFSLNYKKPNYIKRNNFFGLELGTLGSFDNFYVNGSFQYYIPDYMFIDSDITWNSKKSGITEINFDTGVLIYEEFAIYPGIHFSSPATTSTATDTIMVSLGVQDLTEIFENIFCKFTISPIFFQFNKSDFLSGFSFPTVWNMEIYSDRNANMYFGGEVGGSILYTEEFLDSLIPTRIDMYGGYFYCPADIRIGLKISRNKGEYILMPYLGASFNY